MFMDEKNCCLAHKCIQYLEYIKFADAYFSPSLSFSASLLFERNIVPIKRYQCINIDNEVDSVIQRKYFE